MYNNKQYNYFSSPLDGILRPGGWTENSNANYLQKHCCLLSISLTLSKES